jgi:hypothetical protein
MKTEIKWFEIRDRATFIPVMAVRIKAETGPNDSSQAAYLARRAGFGAAPAVQLLHFSSNRTCNDLYDWTDRTMKSAHLYIEKAWTMLEDGAVIDVEFILGETTTAKASEREKYPGGGDVDERE